MAQIENYENKPGFSEIAYVVVATLAFGLAAYRLSHDPAVGLLTALGVGATLSLVSLLIKKLIDCLDSV